MFGFFRKRKPYLYDTVRANEDLCSDTNERNAAEDVITEAPSDYEETQSPPEDRHESETSPAKVEVQSTDEAVRTVEDVDNEVVRLEKEERLIDYAIHDLFEQYSQTIPEANISLLTQMNGIFAKADDSEDIEVFTQKVMESYSPETVKVVATGTFAPGMTKFNGEWHLLIPVVTEPKKSVGLFHWLFAEMERRYKLMLEMKVSSIDSYNNKINQKRKNEGDEQVTAMRLPHIVMIVDELSVLLDDEEVEQAEIQKLIMNGRILGLHMVFFSRFDSRSLFDRRSISLVREYTMTELLSYFESDQPQRSSIEDVDRMEDGEQFEKYSANLLKDLGYTDVDVTPKSKDYGADVLASRNGIRFAFQCKCYSQPVGIGAVQEVLGGKIHYKCDAAIVLTNNEFTDEAKQLASETGVLLWNRTKLIQMINEAQKNRQ